MTPPPSGKLFKVAVKGQVCNLSMIILPHSHGIGKTLNPDQAAWPVALAIIIFIVCAYFLFKYLDRKKK